MPRAGFGGQGDLSGLFAALYLADEENIERRAREHAERGRERDAARDEEMFSKYQHGEVSDDEILAYIRQRVEETKHDPREHAAWSNRLREYEEAIADSRAESAFANGGSIDDLIRHYRDRRRLMEPKSPRYREITERLNQLIDQRADEDISLGADRIVDQIEAGRATIQDLIRFYKRSIAGLRPGSPLRKRYADALDEAQDRHRQQRREEQLARLSFQISSGQIRPGEAADRLAALAAPYRESDPARFWQMMGDVEKLRRDALDDGKFAEIEYLVRTGRISPAEAQSRYERLAQPYKSIDPARYWDLMERAHALGLPPEVPGGAIPDPGALDRIYGASAGGNASGVAFTSQLDNSPFARINCMYASAAMLAQAMGVSGLSGGDMRWRSGDQDWGDMNGVRRAMRSLGLDIEGGRGRVGFNEFTRRVQSGQPALLMGMNGNVPSGFNAAPNFWAGHAVYVDHYDPDKGFFVMDPARRGNYSGQYWPAQVIYDFAWGPAVNGQSLVGQAAFAPQRFLTGERRRAPGRGPIRVDRTRPRLVSVFDAPREKKTPRGYGQGSDRGIQGRAINTMAASGVRPTIGGAEPLPRSADELRDYIERDLAVISTAEGINAAFRAGQPEFIDFRGNSMPLTPEVLAEYDEAAMWSFDRAAAFYDALDDDDAAAALAERRVGFLAGVAQRNTIEPERALNTVLREARRDLARASDEELDPGRAYSTASNVGRRLTRIATDYANANIDPEFGQRLTDMAGAVGVLLDKGATPEQHQAALDVLGGMPGLGGTGAQSFFNQGEMEAFALMSGVTLSVSGIEAGTHVPVVLPPRHGANQSDRWSIAAMPVVERPVLDPATGQQIVVREPIAGAPTIKIGLDINGRPTAVDAVVGEVPIGEGYNYWIATSEVRVGGIQFRKGEPISSQALTRLTPEELSRLQAGGQIELTPVTAQGIVVPSHRDPATGRMLPEQTWLQDPGTGKWYKDRLPLRGAATDPNTGAVLVENGNPVLYYKPFAHLNGVPVPYVGQNPKQFQGMVNRGDLGDVAGTHGRDEAGMLTDQMQPHEVNRVDAYVPSAADSFQRNRDRWWESKITDDMLRARANITSQTTVESGGAGWTPDVVEALAARLRINLGGQAARPKELNIDPNYVRPDIRPAGPPPSPVLPNPKPAYVPRPAEPAALPKISLPPAGRGPRSGGVPIYVPPPPPPAPIPARSPAVPARPPYGSVGGGSKVILK